MKLRNAIREIGTAKIGADMRDRPSVASTCCAAATWQLEPPDGRFLGDIPTDFIRRARQYVPGPTVNHGQSIMWGGGEHGIEGVTELED